MSEHRIARDRRSAVVVPALSAIVALVAALTVVAAPTVAQEETEPPPEAVVLARSDQPADALAAGPVAGVLGAPVLLTTRTSLLEVTADALTAIDPDLVILAGGEGALSAAVEAAVEDLGYPTQRAAGADRHETAALIAGLLAELGTGRPLLSGAPITDEVIPGLNAERLGGMTLAEVLEAAEPDEPDDEPTEIVLSHSTAALTPTSPNPAEVLYRHDRSILRRQAVDHPNNAHLVLSGPETIGAEDYALGEVEYCITDPFAGGTITAVLVHAADRPAVVGADHTDRDEGGCFTIDVVDPGTAYSIEWRAHLESVATVSIESVRTTWVPRAELED